MKSVLIKYKNKINVLIKDTNKRMSVLIKDTVSLVLPFVTCIID